MIDPWIDRNQKEPSVGKSRKMQQNTQCWKSQYSTVISRPDGKAEQILKRRVRNELRTQQH